MSSKSDLALSVRDIAKAYVIAHGAEKHTTAGEAMMHRLKKPLQKVEREEFWALKDISFDVHKGEVVGIMGRNGAGKSTLLKVLSRITEPTKGVIDLYGRVGSLLEVGTGFHPELTGRENIYLNGAILGMRKTEIAKQFDAIVDFSGVEKFLDTPVKRYSSGMYVRLAFAVAAHLQSEILIVDEVLAVGDAEFQRKCLGKMQDVASQGRTVLFVSHNMATVQALCTRGILLRNGTVAADETAQDAVAAYLRSVEQSAESEIAQRTDRRGKGVVRLTDIEVMTGDDLPSFTLATGRPALFAFHFNQVLPGMTCVFTLYNQHGQPVATINSAVNGADDSNDPQLDRQFVCEIDELPLTPGRYRINVMVNSGGELQDHLEGAKIFDVEQGTLRGRPISRDNGYGSVCLMHRWTLAESNSSFSI